MFSDDQNQLLNTAQFSPKADRNGYVYFVCVQAILFCKSEPISDRLSPLDSSSLQLSEIG